MSRTRPSTTASRQLCWRILWSRWTRNSNKPVKVHAKSPHLAPKSPRGLTRSHVILDQRHKQADFPNNATECYDALGASIARPLALTRSGTRRSYCKQHEFQTIWQVGVQRSMERVSLNLTASIQQFVDWMYDRSADRRSVGKHLLALSSIHQQGLQSDHHYAPTPTCKGDDIIILLWCKFKTARSGKRRQADGVAARKWIPKNSSNEANAAEPAKTVMITMIVDIEAERSPILSKKFINSQLKAREPLSKPSSEIYIRSNVSLGFSALSIQSANPLVEVWRWSHKAQRECKLQGECKHSLHFANQFSRT